MHITHFAWIVGLAYVLVGLVLVLNPDGVRRGVFRFPRHRLAGRVLAAAALSWTAVMLWQSPLGWFEPYRRWLPVLAIVIYVLTILFVDELLAPRAAGGLLLLAAAPVLDAIRWEPTAWRFALTIQAYVWVVIGMIVVFSPFRFRRVCEWLYQPAWHAKGVGGMILAVGGGILLLAMTLYPRPGP